MNLFFSVLFAQSIITFANAQIKGVKMKRYLRGDNEDNFIVKYKQEIDEKVKEIAVERFLKKKKEGKRDLLYPNLLSLISSEEQMSCVLKAKLFHPYDDPDEAPLMGYHADWLLVTKGEDPENYCYSLESKQAWCTYKNLDTKDGDSAYIGNVDDYYKKWAAVEDQLFKEEITINNAENITTYFDVSHYFFDEDYYSEYDCWNDHLMAATLTIEVESQDLFLSPKGGWSHDVDVDVPTHTADGKVNQDYQGNFSVAVTCSASCDCTVDYVHGISN